MNIKFTLAMCSVALLVGFGLATTCYVIARRKESSDYDDDDFDINAFDFDEDDFDFGDDDYDELSPEIKEGLDKEFAGTCNDSEDVLSDEDVE